MQLHSENYIFRASYCFNLFSSSWVSCHGTVPYPFWTLQNVSLKVILLYLAITWSLSSKGPIASVCQYISSWGHNLLQSSNSCSQNLCPLEDETVNEARQNLIIRSVWGWMRLLTSVRKLSVPVSMVTRWKQLVHSSRQSWGSLCNSLIWLYLVTTLALSFGRVETMWHQHWELLFFFFFFLVSPLNTSLLWGQACALRYINKFLNDAS